MKSIKTYPAFVRRIDDFDQRRHWIGLDSGDLVKSIMLEAAELLEHYQWDGTLCKRGKAIQEKNQEEIADEAADIFIYLIKFCRESKIDLLSAAFAKLEKTEKKYPEDYQKNGGHEAYLRIKKAHRKK